MDLSRMSTRFEIKLNIVLKSNVFLLQVLCPTRTPAVRNWGHVSPPALWRRRLQWEEWLGRIAFAAWSDRVLAAEAEKAGK